MSLLSLAAGALGSGTVDDVSGTIDKPVYNLGGDLSFGSMRSPERGGAVGSALGAGTGVGGAGGNVGLGASTAANAGNALAALLGGESGNIKIGETTANLGMLVQGISMGIKVISKQNKAHKLWLLAELLRRALDSQPQSRSCKTTEAAVPWRQKVGLRQWQRTHLLK